ncbi:uncharacterized protein LOC128671274 [Plodia interpunctella]|uniref:uncharacterized protein LOC128671274 n=1 Tax=Plodia interpunctella TaxID=58824 RepID=UPI00236863DA|nr:uncharacterized protein LOC128671274 [Plodia interpunctella]
MGKGILIVVACCGILVGLFCTFSYLMTTVNPEPLVYSLTDALNSGVSANDTDAIAKSMVNGTMLRDLYEDEKSRGEVTYLKDFLSKQIGALRYGMEKVDLTLKNDKPPKKAETTHFFFKRPRPQTIEPVNTKPNTSNNIAVPLLKKEREERERRSVDELEPHTGAIVLKIADNTGRMITIIVESDAFEYSNVVKESKEKYNKTNNPNRKTDKEIIQKRNTVIEIFNNSLNMDTSGQSSLFLDLSSKNEVMLKINKRALGIMRNGSSTRDTILQTLKNDKLVLYGVANSTAISTHPPRNKLSV